MTKTMINKKVNYYNYDSTNYEDKRLKIEDQRLKDRR